MAARKTTSDKAVEAKPAPKKAPKAAKAPTKPRAEPKGIKRDTAPLRRNRKGGEAAEPVSPLISMYPAPPDMYKEMGLKLQEAIFVEQYLTHFNQTRAYQESHPESNYKTARTAGARKMREPHIVAYRDARMKALFERAEAEQDRLLRAYTMTAYADPNELVEHRRDACRFCYGTNHQYQFTPAEFERYKAEHTEEVKAAKVAGINPPEFDPKGGVGFNPNLEPNEDCPECFGRGHSATIIKDTRHLSPAALLLYAGMKESKDGIEIKMHSQQHSREVLAKVHKIIDSGNTVNLNFNAEELEAKFGEKMRKAHEAAEKMRLERLAAKDE